MKLLQYDAHVHGFGPGEQVEVKAGDQRAKDAVAGGYAHWVDQPEPETEADPDPPPATAGGGGRTDTR